MVGKLITYEILLELLRNEKVRHEIQKIDDTFFNDLLSYMEEKQKIIDKDSGSDLFSVSEKQKTIVQMQNIRKLVKDLYERREKKIFDLALVNSRTNSNLSENSNLLAEEIVFYNDLFSVLNKYRGLVLTKLLEHKKPNVVVTKVEELPKNKHQLIYFKLPVPIFYGENLELFGPFEEGDFANLPVKIADIIVKKGRANYINR